MRRTLFVLLGVGLTIGMVVIALRLPAPERAKPVAVIAAAPCEGSGTSTKVATLRSAPRKGAPRPSARLAPPHLAAPGPL